MIQEGIQVRMIGYGAMLVESSWRHALIAPRSSNRVLTTR